MGRYKNGAGEAGTIAIGDVIEDLEALEREQKSGGVPSAFQTALFVVKKYGKEVGIEVVTALLSKAMREGKVNAGCFYVCVLLAIHGVLLGRFARKELVSTLERLWLSRQ